MPPMKPATPNSISRFIDRARAARARARAKPEAAAFLRRPAFDDVIDRLETTKRAFPRALLIGADELVQYITPACGVGSVVSLDLAQSRLSPENNACVVGDEDFLPFEDGTFNLVVSFLTLHAVNDLVGALAQIRRALQPDGLFIGVLFGEDTLSQARTAFTAAELDHSGGAAQRFYPFATVRDLGGALQRAGFALPVVDRDSVNVDYRDPARLFDDLKNLGERSALAGRARPLSRVVYADALARLHGTTTRFDLVTMTGWAPHESQQKPAPRGSASHSLADAVRGAQPDRLGPYREE